MFNWRKWKWVRRLAHWMLRDSTTNLTRAPWFSQLDKLVRLARKKQGGENRRQWVIGTIMADHIHRGKQPPSRRELNLAIEYLLSGW